MAYIPVLESWPFAGTRRPRPRPRTIGEYLAIYALAVAAPILVLSGIALHKNVAAERERLEQQSLQIVRLLKSDVDRELSSVILALQTLAASPSLDRGDLAAFHNFASKLVREGSDLYIVLSDLSGQPLVDTRVQWGGALPASESASTEFRNVVRTKEPYVSGLASGEASFTITVPVLRKNEPSALITAAFDSSRLSKLFQSAPVSDGWEYGIIDGQGRLIAHSAGFELDSAKMPPRIRADQADRVELVSAFGRDEFQAVARSTIASWLVMASAPLDVLLPGLWSWQYLALGGGALLSLSLLAALYFGSRLASPIRMTALAASAFGKGEAMPELALRLREVDEVLSALRAASVQRRLAEDQLRIAHERMSLALSATDMGMWERDLATNHVTWSEAMYRLFGRSVDEFSGDPDQVVSYVHPDDRVRFRQAHQDAIRGPADTFDQEFRIVLPSGEERWLYRRAFVRRNSDGVAISVLGVVIDITERKKAENANAYLAAIVASSSEAILSASPDGIIATWNTGAANTFGYSSAEAVGRPLQDLFLDEHSSGMERISAAMAKGETVRLESVCRTKYGHTMEVSIIANPVYGHSGDIAGYSITIRDISVRKEHDRHLASVLRELTHRSKNLLAIIQAMARQTALRSEGLADFEQRFSGRLQSLSRSHELLISNDWEGALLGDLVAVQRSAFGSRHSRIRASGPDVFLRPEAILNIGLALHELASNAERHGALSVATGRVDLSWSVERGKGDEPRLLIVWRERGRQSAGDLLHRGFGRDILEHVTPTALGANVVLKAIPDGLLWTLDVPGDQFAKLRLAAVASA